MPLIEVSGVTHAYGLGAARRTVLRSVDVTFAERRVGVIGANGSGKSTFARLLNGLVLPDHGAVRVAGHDTRREGGAVRRLVGFCFTNPDAQIVMPTVAEDVAFSLRRRGLGRVELDRRVAAVLAQFGLAAHADHPAHLLSGGQKQLLALAAVLVTEPATLILDEPTTLLDLRNAEVIARMVEGLGQQVILLTHHLELLADFDRVLVFDEGALVGDDEPERAIALYRQLVQSQRSPR
jgi:biotin transport system ATP-binding protein